MSTLNEKLTTLADHFREMSGSSNLLTLDEMQNEAYNATEAFETQADLINQISTAINSLPNLAEGISDDVWFRMCNTTILEYTYFGDIEPVSYDMASEIRTSFDANGVNIGLVDPSTGAYVNNVHITGGEEGIDYSIVWNIDDSTGCRINMLTDIPLTIAISWDADYV